MGVIINRLNINSLKMKFSTVLVAASGVLAEQKGRNPMNHLSSVMDTANEFVEAFKDDFPKMKPEQRATQYQKAADNLTRMWNRCGNDSDGNAMKEELERAVSNDVCKAISQVTRKFVSWTESYLQTCSPKKRSNPLARFP